MLVAEGMTVTFGGVRAVDDVSIEVGDAEIVGLVGPNGSGKTTLLNALSGVVPAKGTLRLAGRPVPLGRPRTAWRAGICRVFQAPQVFEDLACVEDVMLSSDDGAQRGFASAIFTRPAMWRHEHRRWRDASVALNSVGLAGIERTPVRQLTYGQRRLLELARGVNGRRRILLLDEPSVGLNDAETQALTDVLLAIRANGTPLLVVDHKIDFINALCDRVTVLQLGMTIAEGPPSMVWQDEAVRSAYLGLDAGA